MSTICLTNQGQTLGERKWYRPQADENPWKAWHVKTNIRGAEEGRLKGRKVAIKDNLFLGGVPLMNGTSILEAFTPEVDANVVTRLLSEGAIVSGKAVCEAYCFSGGSHTSDSEPVQNPHNPAHSAGGSSSRSAALVAGGEVDLAIGCDQGGSIRIPSSFCGIHGLKPTHGLSPYTGILGMGPVIDHVGPMTSTVADNALMLEVIVAADGLDTRQYSPLTYHYTSYLGRDLTGCRIQFCFKGLLMTPQCIRPRLG